MYFTYYMLGIILLPGLIFAAYAQTKVTSNFNKYKQVNYSQMTPVYQKAHFFLEAMGLTVQFYIYCLTRYCLSRNWARVTTQTRLWVN